MNKFFISFIYFFKLIFVKKDVDVLFYYPQHFNRGLNNENLLFKALYKSCNKKNKSYLVFEEPDRKCLQSRNNDTIPFDFLFYLIIFFRKIKFSDKKIGEIFSNIFFRKFTCKNIIVLSQSLLDFFRCCNKESNIFDLQHGIIHLSKNSYVEGGSINKRISKNKINLLLFGQGFKDLLENTNSSKYVKNKAHVIGFSKKNVKDLHTRPNKNIVVTLQFTEDHSMHDNLILKDELYIYIKKNPQYFFYLRNHPRYNNEVNIEEVLKLENVNVAPVQLIDCFEKCSIHLTAYSTVTFEAASFGIPTIFFTSLQSKYNMFQRDFHYPILNDLNYIENNYLASSNIVKKWESQFYSSFNEDKFISLLK